MSTIFQIIEDIKEREKNHLQIMKNIKEQMEKLPKGNVRVLPSNFVVLEYYCEVDRRNVSKSFGKDHTIIPFLRRETEKRKELKKQLTELKKEHDKIRKILEYVDKQLQKDNISNQLKEVRSYENQSPNLPPQSLETDKNHPIEIKKDSPDF